MGSPDLNARRAINSTPPALSPSSIARTLTDGLNEWLQISMTGSIAGAEFAPTLNALLLAQAVAHPSALASIVISTRRRPG